MKFSEVPCWLRNGNLYRENVSYENYHEDIFFEEEYFEDTSRIENIEDFKKIYKISNYWILDKYPLDIYVFGFLNKKIVIDFLQSLKDTSEENMENNSEENMENMENKKPSGETLAHSALEKDIENNISFNKYLEIINDDFKHKKIQSYYKIFPMQTIKNNFYLEQVFLIFGCFQKLIEKKIEGSTDEEVEDNFNMMIIKLFEKFNIHHSCYYEYDSYIINSFNIKNESFGYFMILPDLINNICYEIFENHGIIFKLSITKGSKGFGEPTKKIVIMIVKVPSERLIKAEHLYSVYIKTQEDYYKENKKYMKNAEENRELLGKNVYFFRYVEIYYKSQFEEFFELTSDAFSFHV